MTTEALLAARWRWQAFCDVWLAIGLAATLVRWGSDGIVGWPSEDECREDIAKMVGRVVRKELPWQCRACGGRTTWLTGTGTAIYWAKCGACRGTGRR